jgi:lipopolysaccharide export system protein LptA
MKNVSPLLTACALGAMTLGALAAGTNSSLVPGDSKAPINISSDTFQADLNGKTGTWTGNVLVVQGDTKMRSNSVRMSTTNGKLDKVLASGNVVVDSPKSGVVTGDNGVYSVVPRTVLMTGNVTLKKGKDVMRGAQLTVNLNTGQAVLGGGAKTPGSNTGRVQGVFMPNSN